MTDDTIEIEYSRLCKRFTREGITVDVRIYRLREGDSGWSLEVVDHNDCSTVWDELFPTDQQAYQAFLEAVADEGMHTFLEDTQTLH